MKMTALFITFFLRLSSLFYRSVKALCLVVQIGFKNSFLVLIFAQRRDNFKSSFLDKKLRIIFDCLNGSFFQWLVKVFILGDYFFMNFDLFWQNSLFVGFIKKIKGLLIKYLPGIKYIDKFIQEDNSGANNRVFWVTNNAFYLKIKPTFTFVIGRLSKLFDDTRLIYLFFSYIMILEVIFMLSNKEVIYPLGLLVRILAFILIIFLFNSINKDNVIKNVFTSSKSLKIFRFVRTSIYCRFASLWPLLSTSRKIKS